METVGFQGICRVCGLEGLVVSIECRNGKKIETTALFALVQVIL